MNINIYVPPEGKKDKSNVNQNGGLHLLTIKSYKEIQILTFKITR